jgi:hypothetical protein
MIRLSFLLLCALNFIPVKAQDGNLSTRVKKFYKIEEDKKLSEHDKIKKLSEFIIPCKENESMSKFFYESGLRLQKISRKIKTKIINIEYSKNDSEAIVTTEDLVTYNNGETITFLSKAIWIRLNSIWYRSNQKSILYKNGIRIR